MAFGPHGPRALPPPGENWKVFRLTMYGVLASLAIFLATRSFARGPPRTMTKEYQEASNEYMKVCHINPTNGSGFNMLTSLSGTQHRANHWCLQRGLRWQGPGPDRPLIEGSPSARRVNLIFSLQCDQCTGNGRAGCLINFLVTRALVKDDEPRSKSSDGSRKWACILKRRWERVEKVARLLPVVQRFHVAYICHLIYKPREDFLC